MSHTPGPWEIAHLGNSEGDIRNNAGKVVCEMRDEFTREDDWADDARLIAAAPELLLELKSLLSHWEEAIGWEEAYMPLGDAARAVIAKAEGRE